MGGPFCPKIRGVHFVPTGRVIKYPPKCTPPRGPGSPRGPPGGPPYEPPASGSLVGPQVYPPDIRPPCQGLAIGEPKGSRLRRPTSRQSVHRMLGAPVHPAMRYRPLLPASSWGPSPPHSREGRCILSHKSVYSTHQRLSTPLLAPTLVLIAPQHNALHGYSPASRDHRRDISHHLVVLAKWLSSPLWMVSFLRPSSLTEPGSRP